MSGLERLRRIPPGLLVAACVVLLAAGGWGVVQAARTTPIERALDELAVDDDFARATDAGAAVTRASEHLFEAAEDCGPSADCAELYTATAVARTGAVALLRCGRPQIFAFREGLVDYLDALRAGEPATPPTMPVC